MSIILWLAFSRTRAKPFCAIAITTLKRDSGKSIIRVFSLLLKKLHRYTVKIR